MGEDRILCQLGASAPYVIPAEAACWSAWGMRPLHARTLKPHADWSLRIQSTPPAWACTTETTAAGLRRWSISTGRCSWTPRAALSIPTEGEPLQLECRRRVWSQL